MSNILILTSELSWHKIVNEFKDCNILILSPQAYDIVFDSSICNYSAKEGDDHGKFKIDGILWREGHVIPESGIRKLITRINNLKLPCINKPNVTLKCMDTVSVIREMKNNNILDKYCKFELHHKDNLDIDPPKVIKLPNYHGGLGKWYVKNSQELEELLSTEQTISWGEHRNSGYLSKEPYLSDYIIVEPFVRGRDTRVYVYRDRDEDVYKFKYLERTAKEGRWMANRHTDTFKVFEEENEEIEKICSEAVKILNYPDIIGVDFIRGQDDITILEINNDVPGLNALSLSDDYSIHKTLISNLKIIAKK